MVPYASNLYTRESLKLLFALDERDLKEVESARGLQQGCNLDPLCYSAGSLKILKGTLPRHGSYGRVAEWLLEHLGVERISLNRRELQDLLVGGVGPEHLTEEQRTAKADTGLTVVRQEMGLVGVLV